MRRALHTIGLLGGTFDPIHYGHLRPAEEVREALQLAELRLIPVHIPPHRARPRAAPQIRAELAALAVRDNPGVQVDGRELRRCGPSYSIDTLVELRVENPGAALIWIVGYDTFLALPQWSRWQRLFDLAHLVVARRPGIDGELAEPLRRELAKRQVGEPSALRNAPAGLVYFQAVTPVSISATEIRRALATGRSVRYLMPEAVRRRVVAEGLYGYPQL